MLQCDVSALMFMPPDNKERELACHGPGGGRPPHLPFFLPLSQMSKVWNDLKPKLSCLFAGPHSVLTPPRSPQEDGVCPH